jgi:tRNA pseudouridine55 synthase
MNQPDPCGVLVVDKPNGITSHDVVNRVRRAYQTRQVGHTGTLDPMATGVMVLCIGAATRLAEYLTACNKHYTAEFTFGMQSDSYDTMGTILETRDASHITAWDVEAALPQFTGSILQVPPMVSAVHHQGKRLYQLAREGKTVERNPRAVVVDELLLTDFEAGGAAKARLEITCSSGFYVRVLADDLGRSLGVGAVMSGLRRPWVGHSHNDSFSVDRAVPLDDISNSTNCTQLQKWLVPMESAVTDIPSYKVQEQVDVDLVSNGVALPATHTVKLNSSTKSTYQGTVMLFTPSGRLLAMAKEAEGMFQPFKVFKAQ